MSYPRVASFKTADDFRTYLAQIGADIPFDANVLSGLQSPLAQMLPTAVRTVGNRFAILPMEGWDGTEDGHPSELTLRRWTRFGASGAKLIWGGEAVAVRHDGRANPNQLVASEATLVDLARLRQALVAEHLLRYGRTDDLLIGLQLTHSGRFSKPNDKKRMEPRTLYRHPILDRKYNVPEGALLSDDEIDGIIAAFGPAAAVAQRAGYDFVDLKHCHGYLGHEFLTAHDRPGRYGGSWEIAHASCAMASLQFALPHRAWPSACASVRSTGSASSQVPKKLAALRIGKMARTRMLSAATLPASVLI